MTVQITIIGLGQIGTSAGLALAGQKELVRRIGHDRDIRIARQAEKMGALDRVEINLPNSVRDSDLILLSLPADQIRETIEIIAPDLKEGAVVMDTGPAKEAVVQWVKELIPPQRHYVGLTPVINPAYLHQTETGVDAAREDLFQHGLMAIVAPVGTNSEALKLAADLTRLLGSTPLFSDPVEVDGLMGATHLLPQLMAAALLNATTDQPGWREARKFAGRAYAEVSGPIVHLGEASTLKAAVLMNRENIVRLLDSAVAALMALRNDIQAGDEASLDERLKRARKGRERWWKQRQAGDWPNEEAPGLEMPENTGMMARLFGTAWGQRKSRKTEE